ncbi:MAG: BON domain-containing protein [Alphaproteobacteria bacterium]|nr:BON domain-containing protein [Alphaproteobacteria bacterium]
MHKNFGLIATALALVLVLPACAPVGVAAGVGATMGVAAAQEGGLSRAATDARIQVEINDLWFRSNVDMFSKLDLTINEGRVLITGVVQNPEHRVEAVRLAWQPKGVKQVINEIRVANSEGITGYAKDTWISARLRTALIFDKKVQSINYSIDTVQGTVYLMGYAQDKLELNLVLEKARTINGVKNVVSYVKFVGGDLGDSGSVNSNNAGYSASPAAAPVQNYESQSYGTQTQSYGQENSPAPSSYEAPAYNVPTSSSGGMQRQGIESEVLN